MTARSSNLLDGVALSLLTFGVLNFGVFLVVDLCLGGDALNGKLEAGRYYLGQNGRFTEVSSVDFWFSRIHAICSVVLFLLALFSGATLAYRWHRERTAPA